MDPSQYAALAVPDAPPPDSPARGHVAEADTSSAPTSGATPAWSLRLVSKRNQGHAGSTAGPVSAELAPDRAPASSGYPAPASTPVSTSASSSAFASVSTSSERKGTPSLGSGAVGDLYPVGRLSLAVMAHALSWAPLPTLAKAAQASRHFARAVADERVWGAKWAASEWVPVHGWGEPDPPAVVRWEKELRLRQRQESKDSRLSRKPRPSASGLSVSTTTKSNSPVFGTHTTLPPDQMEDPSQYAEDDDDEFGQFASSEPSWSEPPSSSNPSSSRGLATITPLAPSTPGQAMAGRGGSLAHGLASVSLASRSQNAYHAPNQVFATDARKDTFNSDSDPSLKGARTASMKSAWSAPIGSSFVPEDAASRAAKKPIPKVEDTLAAAALLARRRQVMPIVRALRQSVSALDGSLHPHLPGRPHNADNAGDPASIGQDPLSHPSLVGLEACTQALLLANVARLIAYPVLMLSESEAHEVWPLLLRTAQHLASQALLPRFIAADARRSDAQRAGEVAQQASVTQRAVERAEEEMRSTAHALWHLGSALQKEDPATVSTHNGTPDSKRVDLFPLGGEKTGEQGSFKSRAGEVAAGGPFVIEDEDDASAGSIRSLGPDSELDPRVADPTSMAISAAAHFLETRHMFGTALTSPLRSHDPLSNVLPGADAAVMEQNAHVILDFSAMDAFMASITAAVQSDGTVAARVFPSGLDVVLALADKVAEDVVMVYIKPLLARASELDDTWDTRHPVVSIIPSGAASRSKTSIHSHSLSMTQSTNTSIPTNMEMYTGDRSSELAESIGAGAGSGSAGSRMARAARGTDGLTPPGVYPRAFAAAYTQSLHLAVATRAVQGPGKNTRTRARCEEVVHRMISPLVGGYLSKERFWVEAAMRAPCALWTQTLARREAEKNEAASAAETSNGQPLEPVTGAPGAANAKRSALAAARNALLKPVVLVPRAAASAWSGLRWNSTTEPATQIPEDDKEKDSTSEQNGSIQNQAQQEQDLEQDKQRARVEAAQEILPDEDAWGTEQGASVREQNGPSSQSLASQTSIPRQEKANEYHSGDTTSGSNTSMASLLDLDTVVQVIQAHRQSLRRMEAFCLFEGEVGQSARRAREEVALLFFALLDRDHVQPAFQRAQDTVAHWSPALSSSIESKHSEKETSEQTSRQKLAHTAQAAEFVAPVVQFTALTHVADALLQLVQVYVDTELLRPIGSASSNSNDKDDGKAHASTMEEANVAGAASTTVTTAATATTTDAAATATNNTSVADFLHPVVREQARFQRAVDARVALGLNLGVDVLMRQAEYLLSTLQKASDFDPPPPLADMQSAMGLGLPPPPPDVSSSTYACEVVTACLAVHCRILRDVVERETRDVFFREIGTRLHGLLLRHLKRQVISTRGGWQVIADMNSYHTLVVQHLRLPDLGRLFDGLKMLAHLFVVEGARELSALVKDGRLAADGAAGPPEEVAELLRARKDYRSIAPDIDKELYGFKVREDCCIQ